MQIINRSFLSIAAVAVVALMVLTAAGAFPYAARADQDGGHGFQHEHDYDDGHNSDGHHGASIVIVKQTIGADGTFDFTGSLGAVEITTTSHAGQFTADHLQSGTYSIAETAQPGWDLTSSSCDNGDSPSAISINHKGGDGQDGDDTDEDGQTIDHHEGHNHGHIVTCTFVNTARGHLIVHKTTNPAQQENATVFPITASGDGSITGGGAATVSSAAPQNYEVTPGTYSVVEDLSNLPLWQQVSNTCTGVVVAAGATVDCTIVNKEAAVITVNKTSVGGFGTFHFDGLGQEGGFDLTTNADHNPASQSFNVFVDPSGSNLSVTEDLFNNDWTVQSQCDLTNVLPGSSRDCSFTNTKKHHGEGDDNDDHHGTINVVKIIDADGKLSTTNDQTPGAGWQFSTGEDTVTTNAQGHATIHVASESQSDVTEVSQDGFTLVSSSCVLSSHVHGDEDSHHDGEDRGHQDGENDHQDGHHHGEKGIDAHDGDVITCTFYNTPVQAPACNAEASSVVVSDASTIDTTDSQASALLTFIHSAWTATTTPVVFVSGAKWIWSTDPVIDPTVDTTKVFTKTFTIVGTPTGGTLDIGADNGFLLKVNGITVADQLAVENNYSASKHYDISADLVSGSNTIEVTVKNFGVQGAVASENPAGLVFQAHINNNECVVPPPPQCPVGTTGIYPVCTPVVPECSANQILVENSCVSCLETQHVVGNQCVDNTPDTTPTDVCSNISGVQTSAPSGTHIDGTQCVENGSGGGGNGPIAGSIGGGGGGGGNSSPVPQGQVLGASTSDLPNGCSALLTQYMRKGNKKNDPAQVKLLQQFLNDEMHSNLPISGFFGTLTENAVKAFQAKYPETVLNPWTLSGPTGLVYRTTERWINLKHCASLNIPMPDLVPWSQQ